MTENFPERLSSIFFNRYVENHRGSLSGMFTKISDNQVYPEGHSLIKVTGGGGGGGGEGVRHKSFH